ncbi:MAG: serine--tRNA ligase [Thermoplasmata archaeon]|nr:serine--tRNA ligase [Thermoplasmata archaeon]
MPNRLRAEVLLSSAPEGGRAALEPIVTALANEAIEKTLNRRGGGRVVEWELAGPTLSITIEAPEARPHGTLLAFSRRLGEELGRAQKIGVRSLRAPEYRLEFILAVLPTTPVSIPIPHTLTLDGDRATLTLLDLDETALRENWADRAVKLLEEKIRRQSYAGKEQYWTLLRAPIAREPKFLQDPTEAMIKRQWVRGGPTKGKWFLGPSAAHLLRTMERIAREEVLLPLGFREVVQPHHDSFETLLKTGHLEGLPGEFYYVVEPKSRDPAVWERFTDLVKITQAVPTEELARLVTGPTAVLCYAQCPTTYWWLSGRTLATDSLPLLVFDRAAVSNRYESGGRHGLERVDEFHRIEPVYLGTPEQLVALRERLLERYIHVFDKILELEWRTAWVTPFFMQQAGVIASDDPHQRIQGTIDFEAWLPYRGTREGSEWLEFQNLSIVGDKYTKAFTIKTQKGELWSGCTGIGLERWMVAFLAQKGLDVDGWPDGFRRYAEPLPNELHFL